MAWVLQATKPHEPRTGATGARRRVSMGCLAGSSRLVVLSALPFVLPAWADSGDTFNLTTSYTVQTDSNLFRLPSDAPAPTYQGHTTKSERVDTRAVKMRLDKEYSLQRFQLNASYADNRHQNFDYLNFAGLNYDGTWFWSVTPRVRGSFHAERTEALNSFADVGGINIRNIRTDTAVKLDGEADLGAAVRLLGSVQQSRRTNEQTVVQEGDSTVNSVLTGLRYIFPSGNSVSYRLRRGTGDYYNRNQDLASAIPNSFRETEHEIQGNWRLTGKTAVSARISQLERTHPGVSQRDFSGPTANFGVVWNPTAKLGLAAGLSRSLSAYQTETSSFITNNRLSIAPVWRATAHTSLRFNYEYLDQEYDGAPSGQGLPANRRDTTRMATVAVDWRPRQFFSLTLSLQNQRRSSNTTGFDFNSNAASIGAELNF